jgi:O-antigen ligase
MASRVLEDPRLRRPQINALSWRDEARRVSRTSISGVLTAIALIIVAGDHLTFLDQFFSDRTRIIKLVALPCAAAGMLLSDFRQIWRSKISLSLLGFLVFTVFSVSWVANPKQGIFLAKGFALPMFFIVLALPTFPRSSIVNAVRWCSVGLITLTALDCLVFPSARIGKASPEDFSALQQGFRGSFQHKNLMAVSMTIAVCAVLAFERHDDSEIEKKRRLVRFASVATGVTLVLLTRSGTGIASLAVPSMFPLLGFAVRATDRRARSARVALIGALVLTVSLTVYLGIDAALALLGKDRTLSNRTEIWRWSIAAIKQRPWFGYGWGGVFTDTTLDPTYTINRRVGFAAAHAHSGPLQLLLQLGVMGLVWMLLMLVGVIRRGLRELAAGRMYEGFFLISIPSALLLAGLAEPTLDKIALVLLSVIYALVLHRDVTPAKRRRRGHLVPRVNVSEVRRLL